MPPNYESKTTQHKFNGREGVEDEVLELSISRHAGYYTGQLVGNERFKFSPSGPLGTNTT